MWQKKAGSREQADGKMGGAVTLKENYKSGWLLIPQSYKGEPLQLKEVVK